MDCLFCKIAKGEIKSFKVWEDQRFIAFLTPFPNTPGFTVIATKDHYDSYLFDMNDEIYTDILKAAKTVGKLIDKNLGTERTALIAEGMGIPHLHVKLFPMHGLGKEWKPVLGNDHRFFDQYPGYILTNDGPKWPEDKLEDLAKKIRGE